MVMCCVFRKDKDMKTKPTNNQKTFQHLSLSERIIIEQSLNDNLSIRQFVEEAIQISWHLFDTVSIYFPVSIWFFPC